MKKNRWIPALWLLFAVSCIQDKAHVDLSIEQINYVTPTSAVVSSIVDGIEGEIDIIEAGIVIRDDELGFEKERFEGNYRFYLGDVFATGLSGLSPNSNYTIAPYAETDEGDVFYGDTLSFKTAPVQYLTDERDQQKYMTHQYGLDVWMIENFNYSSEESRYYDNDSLLYHQYGRLYTYSEAEAVCPQGWHLPTRSNWVSLVSQIAEDDKAASMMLVPGMHYWSDIDFNGFTNQSGFSVLPSGKGRVDGGNISFSGVGENTIFWSQKADDGNVYSRMFSDHDDRALELSLKPDSEDLFSVRCVKDSN
ncbi:MAG: FISUMP domain-containing protein [Prolixibacteraceae bacterium]|jgi:uncharacterized protein (TIGR02145 family)|nr:FISUMP domain-containing protein [Prolixibacteraceae bacterium]